ncbi:MAG: hypothetical protein KDB05_17930, partial [Planctomycetales bacterium]|nr:hypothetical protein [Planctomycetales bacterium]
AFASGSGVDETSFSFTPNDNGQYQITLTVTDEDGGTASANQTITVANAAPTVAANHASVSGNEGETVSNTGTFGDVGHDAVTISVSHGTITQSNAAGTWSWSLATTDGPDDSGTITITATDSDNAVTTTTFNLTVNNAPPTVTRNLATVTVSVGATATNTGTFADVGNDTVTITASSGTITQDNVAGTWSWSLATSNGTAIPPTVTITATDGDSAATQTSFQLTANTVDPVVRRALQLDADLVLSASTNPRPNSLGLNEKWLRDTNKELYYITPDGNFYAWKRTFPPTTTQIATLSPAVYANPALLHDAAMFLPTDTASLPATLALLDEVYGFALNGEHWENWGNRGEKWLKDRNNAWYFILPNGELYLWDGTPRATGALIANLGPTVHADPRLLWNAYVAPEAEASGTNVLGGSLATAGNAIGLGNFTPPFPIRIGAWTNPLNEFDVNHDGFVSPLDALIVINRINAIGTSIPLVANAPVTHVDTYYDVTNDGWLSPLDVLRIINKVDANSLPNSEGSDNNAASIAIGSDSSEEDIWGIALEKYLTEEDDAWWNDLVG